MKQCSKCDLIKPEKEFYKRAVSADGLTSQCKCCILEANKERHKAYYECNKESIRVKHREWHNENRESVCSRKRKRRKENPEKFKAKAKEYRLKNKEKIKAYHKEYGQRIRTRISQACRARVREALKNKSQKAFGTEALLGCSIDELKTHLESQFTEGMTWENYGEWHIDHIRPCASFNLTDPAEQKICFHYSNIQPLWASDNLSKGDKI
jgi:hypothetical protein